VGPEIDGTLEISISAWPSEWIAAATNDNLFEEGKVFQVESLSLLTTLQLTLSLQPPSQTLLKSGASASNTLKAMVSSTPIRDL
jgi:hypothetical protein